MFCPMHVRTVSVVGRPPRPLVGGTLVYPPNGRAAPAGGRPPEQNRISLGRGSVGGRAAA